MSFTTAAAVPTVGEAAVRGLALTGVEPGGTVLIHGASGGVGAVAVQLALRQGMTVIGTCPVPDAYV